MKKFLTLILILIISVSSFLNLSASAEEIKMIDSEIFVVSRGGDTRLHPQNSLEAYKACLDLDVDAISATARKTKDGKIVLFENESTLDICVDKSGQRIDKKIAETDYSTLSSYFLLSPDGKALSEKTNSKILLMTDAFKIIKGKMIMIIDCEAAIIDDVYDAIFFGENAKDVIIRCTDMKAEELLTWANSKTPKPEIMASYHGNVIFTANQVYDFACENNFCGAEFTTKNPYGVIFEDTFTKKFSTVKTLSRVYDPQLCGGRPDSVTGWEDIISRGYTIIETGNAAEFSAYVSLVETNMSSLKILYDKYSNMNIVTYSPESTKEFNKCLEEARVILTSEHASSVTDITKCIENLKLAAENLELADGDNTSLIKITPMKIFWIIFAIALFSAAHFYIFKKTDKKNKGTKKTKKS